MTIETLEVAGFESAMWAMRNPLDSWSRGDTYLTPEGDLLVGPHDKDLSLRLQKAGTEHAKHLRMIQVWADILAPRYWLTEMDTYRAGVEKISCSTMHTIMKNPFQTIDFAYDVSNALSCRMAENNAIAMNALRSQYLQEEDPDKKKAIWRTLIQNLPQSFLQRRTYMFSYAALRNIVRQRANHKLIEWHQFIDWCRTLPESWMIFDEEEPA